MQTIQEKYFMLLTSQISVTIKSAFYIHIFMELAYFHAKLTNAALTYLHQFSPINMSLLSAEDCSISMSRLNN